MPCAFRFIICSRTAAVVALATVPLHAGDVPGAKQQEMARWPTDEPVRKGMLAIRDLVRLNHSLITHRRMPPDHAARFAKAIKTQADTILATSKASGAARERLRALTDAIIAGVEAVAGRNKDVSPIDGLVRIDEALARYPGRVRPPRLGAPAVVE